MADAKITQLTELETADGADLTVVVDDVAGTPTTKKITLTNIAAWLASLTQTLTNKTLTSPKINEDVALTLTSTQLNNLLTGWITVSDTWVYASASTFTIAGVDRTAIYQKGTRLRFKQGGAYKYAVVVNSSFSTNTTVTIAVNTDYTIANAAITDNYYSYQVSPEGYPDWFSYTATLTGFSANPAFLSKFSIIGTTCIVNHTSYFNGTSNATTYTVTLPVTAKTISDYSWRFFALVVSNNVPVNGSGVITSGATSIILYTAGLGAFVASGNKSANFFCNYEI